MTRFTSQRGMKTDGLPNLMDFEEPSNEPFL